MHFSVLVISKPGEDVDDLLWPYGYEVPVKPEEIETPASVLIKSANNAIQSHIDMYNRMLEEPETIMETSYIQNYGTEYELRFIDDGGAVLEEVGKKDYTYEELPEQAKENARTYIKQDYETAMKYANASDCEKIGYYCCAFLDSEGNRLKTFTREDYKWDWYEIGGRRSNSILKKNGEYASVAKVGEIDLENWGRLSGYSEDSHRRLWKYVAAGDKSVAKDENEKEYFEAVDGATDLKTEHISSYKTEDEYIDSLRKYPCYTLLSSATGWEDVPLIWEGQKKVQSALASCSPEDTVTIVDCHE